MYKSSELIKLGNGLKASNFMWSPGGGHSATVSDGTYTNTAGGASQDDAITAALSAVEFRQTHPDSYGHIIATNGLFGSYRVY